MQDQRPFRRTQHTLELWPLPRTPEFWARTEHEGDSVVLSLFGELDLASAPSLEKQVKRLQWAGADVVVIDLSGLAFIDSAGLHVLLRAQRRAQAGRLVLLRGPRRVHRVFELSGVDAQLPFAD